MRESIGNIFSGKTVLVCGGTGSIGSEIVGQLLKRKVAQVRVFARDEAKHQGLLAKLNYPKNLRSLIGDIRDRERLRMAMDGVDIVFNAAALKHISYCEYNPFEAVKTNIYGTQNVIETALEADVEKVITISTDKAAEPTSVLGATKLLSERITAAADYFKGRRRTRFCAVRFGNVLGSRNSIIPLVKQQLLADGVVKITDVRMTRFTMSIADAVKLIFEAAAISKGGEVFILKMPAVRIKDLIEILAEEFAKKYQIEPATIKFKHIGLRPGEKLHEKLLTSYEAVNAYEDRELFLVTSDIAKPNKPFVKKHYGSFKKVAFDYNYDSESSRILNKTEIRRILLAEGLIQ